ncbi:MAG TPA: DUF1365 domain-containing protein [Solirubrobacteraceae bacterium]|nr:DUF1365 domain-containing protein [Solirubrobacteraceae bacterium]
MRAAQPSPMRPTAPIRPAAEASRDADVRRAADVRTPRVAPVGGSHGVASCIYVGTVRHRRSQPRHELRHRLALLYVDLQELPSLAGGALVRRAPGLVRMRRRDYHGEAAIPLDAAVRDTVERATGRRPSGPIRLLAHPRSWGHCFNPVSFYYCFDDGAERLQALVAEVTNTPWGERHAYVMEPEVPGSAVLRASFAKRMHVSPLQPMDRVYRCAATIPASTLSLHVESLQAGEPAFDATLSLRRRELDAGALRWLAVSFPFATVRVLALIYGHAARTRLAGAPVYGHPARRAG